MEGVAVGALRATTVLELPTIVPLLPPFFWLEVGDRAVTEDEDLTQPLLLLGDGASFIIECPLLLL